MTKFSDLNPNNRDYLLRRAINNQEYIPDIVLDYYNKGRNTAKIGAVEIGASSDAETFLRRGIEYITASLVIPDLVAEQKKREQAKHAEFLKSDYALKALARYGEYYDVSLGAWTEGVSSEFVIEWYENAVAHERILALSEQAETFKAEYRAKRRDELCGDIFGDTSLWNYTSDHTKSYIDKLIDTEITEGKHTA